MGASLAKRSNKGHLKVVIDKMEQITSLFSRVYF